MEVGFADKGLVMVLSVRSRVNQIPFINLLSISHEYTIYVTLSLWKNTGIKYQRGKLMVYSSNTVIKATLWVY